MRSLSEIVYIVILFTVSAFVLVLGIAQYTPKNTSTGIHLDETVRVKKGLVITDFYNKYCHKMTIKGLQAVDTQNLAWVLLENCSWTNSKYYMVTFDQEELEKVE